MTYQPLNDYQCRKHFLSACQAGDVSRVAELLATEPVAYCHLNEGFRQACAEGRLEVVRYLLTAPELTAHADIHHQDDLGLREACLFGHLPVMRYLLESPELADHANVHAFMDNVLVTACWKGYIDIVCYLLTSLRVDIHVNDDAGFMEACARGHLDLVRYLATSPELSDHAPINDRALAFACQNKQKPVMHYLLTSPELPHHGSFNAALDGMVTRWFSMYGTDFMLDVLAHLPDDRAKAMMVSDGDSLVTYCDDNHLTLPANLLPYLPLIPVPTDLSFLDEDDVYL